MVSFDCEGKWGIMDHLTESFNRALTNENLNKAYRRIIDILDRRGIKGTFAFVGAFTMAPEELHANRDWFAEVEIEGRPWFSAFKRAVSLNQFDGWLNPQSFTMVAQRNQHEIAAHGFSHLPLSELSVSREVFIKEIGTLKNVSNFKNREKMTFIYPRNLIGYVNELQQAGFIGYRDGIRPLRQIKNKRISKVSQKITNTINELNFKEPAQPHSKPDNMIRIPRGIFLNWRYGYRRAIPLKFTITKWQNIINDAILHNRVAHLYTHPHNFVTGIDMYLLLDEVLKIVSHSIRRNELVNMTQEEYAESIMSQGY